MKPNGRVVVSRRSPARRCRSTVSPMDTETLKRSLRVKFVEITGDRLQKIQLGVLELDKADPARAADDVSRELHTMKGEARMLGLYAVGQVAHATEDVLKVQREGKLAA